MLNTAAHKDISRYFFDIVEKVPTAHGPGLDIFLARSAPLVGGLVLSQLEKVPNSKRKYMSTIQQFNLGI